MSRLSVLLSLPLLIGCTKAAPLPFPPSHPESLKERRDTCEQVYEKAVDFTLQRRLRAEEATVTSKDYARLRSQWKDAMNDQVLANFMGVCLGGATESQVHCALRAQTLPTMVSCMDNSTE